MRTVLVLSCLAIALLIATVSTSRGDGEQSDVAVTAVDETTEPITGTAATPLKGSETLPHDPFSPYDTGGPAAEWKYEDLTADEKIVADQGLNEDQTKVQDAYAAAAKEMSSRAKSDSAANQLGVENLDVIGVISGEQGGAP